MSKFKSAISMMKKPEMLLLTLGSKGLFNWMPDKLYISLIYFLAFGKKINLYNPQSFNEKLQWLKLYNREPKYSMMVDKYEVKKYIADIIGEEYIIPTLGVWDCTDQINFEELPNQFVLKCTHDSGSILICKDKKTFNYIKAKEKLNKHLKTNPFWFGREWPYKNVKPRIIAEQYLEDKNHQMIDYKIMCFNGIAKCCFVFSDRYSETGVRLNVYDRQWELLPVGREYTTINPNIKKPDNYELMILLAEKIAKQLPFVRVDFYELNGKLFFGEITFFPNSGFTRFKPSKWDSTFGEWITLSTNV